ncbi:hypothetical protein [Crossiella cryophila]|uniref:Uncharacterized protein n=1 Tax=Crossiella cryophila TaxID=43355 RepID=A0A7W7CE04_9PSEU|nr:hypothetical protein [Crossiella cryophila]MBB4679450.1 hypothetical protein [Crossiella cryophila]
MPHHQPTQTRQPDLTPVPTGGLHDQLRHQEVRITEDVLALIDYLSRIVSGAGAGNWFYVHEKLPELIRSAYSLTEALSTADGEDFEEPNVRPAMVMAAITSRAHYYLLGCAISPPETTR